MSSEPLGSAVLIWSGVAGVKLRLHCLSMAASGWPVKVRITWRSAVRVSPLTEPLRVRVPFRVTS
jgi:hypothetical protein